MRIALIGQAQFGEAVFNALREAGEDIVAVSSVRGTDERPDHLWAAAEGASIPVFPTARLKRPDVLAQYSATKPDLCVMAFVTHILPEDVLFAPAHGSIQYHPSLLPRHRGRSAMHWAIRMGDPTTGVTIFWTDKGIDTGPVLLQRECPIGPDDTVGSLYFDKMFPMGVAMLAESVRLVREGNAPQIEQDESLATYEDPADDRNSAILWSRPAREVYDLVRGSNPQPGAHASFGGQLVRVFDAAATVGGQQAPPGTVIALGETIDIALNGGVLHAKRLMVDGGKKIAAADFASSASVAVGGVFEDGSVAASA